MGQLVKKMQSIKIVIGLVLILLAKVDFYLVEKATEQGVNNFIIFVLGFVFVARVADKIVSYKQSEVEDNVKKSSQNRLS